MSNYLPRLEGGAATKAGQLADAITADIRAGRLTVRERMPTHRQLAQRLGIAPGTVSRAYTALQRRGLLSGEVGRGTFVGDPGTRKADLVVGGEPAEGRGGRTRAVDLAVNRHAASWVEAALAETMTALAHDAVLASLMNYQVDSGSLRHRRALSAWLGESGLDVPPERLIVTVGAQHATSVVLSALAQPGEVVLVEEFTYAGFKALADELGLRLEPVAVDGDGIDPDDVARRAEATGAKWLYVMPRVQNPTAAELSQRRRARLMRVVRHLDLRVVEDGVYDFLSPSGPPALAATDPDRVFHVTSFSKSLAPGLRVGCVAAPADHASRLARVIRRSMWMVPALGPEICTQWILDGRMRDLLERQRAELRSRGAALTEILHGMEVTTPPAPAFAWVRLPEAVSSGAVVAQAAELGISVAPTEAFAVRRQAADRFVRLNLGASETVADLRAALGSLAPVLRGESVTGGAYY